MINISNFTSKDNPPTRLAEPVRLTPPAQPTRPGAPARYAAELADRVVLSWLAAIPRRLGDRMFAINDMEAYWRGWQIAKTQGGLARRYRDPRFDTLAEGPKGRGEVS